MHFPCQSDPQTGGRAKIRHFSGLSHAVTELFIKDPPWEGLNPFATAKGTSSGASRFLGDRLPRRARRRDTRQMMIIIGRSEEHTSELQSLMRISYAVFCLKKKKNTTTPHNNKRRKKIYKIKRS